MMENYPENIMMLLYIVNYKFISKTEIIKKTKPNLDRL